MAAQDSGRRQPGDEMVTVAVANQQFAIDIMAVREIRGWTPSTPLPNAPAHLLGMINLRGLILPVIDLSAQLGLGPCQATPSSVVVVAQIGERQVGLLVDGVCDILVVRDGMVQPTPNVGAAEAALFVRGVITTTQGIIGLLALEHVVPAAASSAEAA